MMIGENDFQVENNRGAERLMQDKGMMAKLVVYQGVGHAFPPNGGEEVLKAIRWVESAK
jgi:acetyl esterase/lipase